MFAKKVFFASLISLIIVSSTSAAYTEVACSTNTVFAENSCNQCFDWGVQSAWDNIGLLTDVWVNSGSKDLILYKDEQDNPTITSLNGSVWGQTPDGDNFWKYTENMENLYSEDEAAYVLPVWQSVDWLESRFGYAYTLEENNAEAWSDIWLLIYPMITHAINSWGDIEPTGETYKECVLFKSAEAGVVTTPEEPPKELPQTGPESILLLLLAMLLGFGVLKLTKQA